MFLMMPVAFIWVFLRLLSSVPGEESRDPSVRKLRNEAEILSAMIDDHETSFMTFQKGQKRKRGSEACIWVAQAREVLEEAQSLLTQDEPHSPQKKRQRLICSARSSSIVCKVAVQRCIDILVAHGNKVCLCSVSRLLQGLASQCPCRGMHIPVGKLVGQVAFENVTKLQGLLLDPSVKRIAIHGMKGIGKTSLMKHLYNHALKYVEMFDFVFWVTCPEQYCIQDLQDNLAMAVKCDISGIRDLKLRARKLSETLLARGKIVIFLDAAVGANSTLEQIGIPLSSDVSSCKVVITTSCPLSGGSLNTFQIVPVNPLSQEEALDLFMTEAGIDKELVSQLNDFPRLLCNKCRGVPRTIVDTATWMRGIVDIREWRFSLLSFR